jgi:serine/threonine protein kinase
MANDSGAGFRLDRDLLGIEVNGQRPNYYELLGLPSGELCAPQVDAAYEQRIAGLQSLANGEHGAMCRRLAEDMGVARDCLRDAGKRRDYDLQLHTQSLLKPMTRDDLRDRQKSGRWRGVVPPQRPAADVDGGLRAASVATSNSTSETPRTGGGQPERPRPTDPEPSGDSMYGLLRVIGRGSMTTVYEAYDHSLRRYVAIRQLDKEVSDDPQRSEFFWKEARFFAGLDHENLVSILSVDSERGWVIMDLMRCNLRDKLTEGTLPADAVRSVLRQVLRGLSYLHGREKLHGEIKPSSILIDDQGRVKLSDSPGFSMGAEFRMPTGLQLHVAPELLSPETFGQVGPGVDLYCLGFAVLELLLGDGMIRHFKGINRQNAGERTAWMRWHTSPESLPPTKEIVSKLPDDLALVIDRLVKKQVADRYPNAEAALADLEDRPLILLDPSRQSTNVEAASTEDGPAVRFLGTPPKPNTVASNKPESPDATPGMPWHKSAKRIASRPAVFYSLCGMGLCFLGLVLLAGLSSSPAKPQPVEMQLGSTPSGARVYVNGNRLPNETPTTAMLMPGNYELRWEKDGYDTATRTITVRNGERNTFISDLAQSPVQLPPAAPPNVSPRLGPPRNSASREIARKSPVPDEKPEEVAVPDPPANKASEVLASKTEPTRAGAAEPPPSKCEAVPPEISLRAECLPVVGCGLDATETAAFRRHVREIIVKGTRDPSREWESHFEAATKIAPNDPRPYHAAAIVLFQRANKFDETTAREQAFSYLQQGIDKLRDESVPDQIPYFDPWRHYIYLLLVQDDRAGATRECYFLAKRIGSFTNNVRYGLRCRAELVFVTQSLGCLQEATDNSARLAPYEAYDAEITAALDNQPEMSRLYSNLRAKYAERMRYNRDKANGHLATQVPRQSLDVLGDQLLKTLSIEYYGG